MSYDRASHGMDPTLPPPDAHAALAPWWLDLLALPASGLWPFWAGALGLAVVAVGFPLLLGRPFGVSSAVGRALDPRKELALDRRDDEAPLGSGMIVAPARLPLPRAAARARDTWLANVVFLGSIALGGFVAAISSGTFGVSSYEGVYETLVARGPLGLVALFGGGLFVGFGTQLSGGCTSGHGLVGCARMQAPSIAATATFFGTGVLVSLLLAWVRA
ncbi:MAG: YeeE/YedE thiosulfate transporter family protein [Sandaracinus sp.]